MSTEEQQATVMRLVLVGQLEEAGLLKEGMAAKNQILKLVQKLEAKQEGIGHVGIALASLELHQQP